MTPGNQLTTIQKGMEFQTRMKIILLFYLFSTKTTKNECTIRTCIRTFSIIRILILSVIMNRNA